MTQWYMYSFNRPPVRPGSSRDAPLDDDSETEASVLANFDFLQNDVEDEEDNDDENFGEENNIMDIGHHWGGGRG